MSDERLRAKVVTYGGRQTVQHWTLYVGREGVADTWVPETAALYEAIARRLNDAESQNQALQERVMEAQAAADDANTVLSHNRGISGFIADDDPQRPTDQWEPYVADLRDKLAALQERAEKAEGWLRFIADTQHRLLDAFKIELSDEEWDAFADALAALSPTQETDPE